jgi:hypothetical protein
MSSTYSTNLALELIGTGDQAGNWGSTTNTNIGILLEQAISGYVTQSMPGTDVTLSMTQGASATARNMFIELTGTGGASLIVPVNKKLYFVYNSTSVATTVKVSGQTGVSVPAGAKIALVCNGTDVVTATNYMTGATFPSPTLTGVPVAPTASVGTNTTQIATTAFVQAAAIPLSTIYPIGSIYTSTVSTNPNTLFGFGTWVAFGAGRVLLGDGGGYAAGATGGSADAIVVSHSHSATTTSTDSGHTHGISPGAWTDGGGKVEGNSFSFGGKVTATQSSTANISSSTSVATTGSSGTGANLQPYVVVYMWNRTA